MGTAGTDEASRAALLHECERWDFPATEWEARAVEAIRRLAPVRVERVPAQQLARAGMEPHECHANAAWYAANDPSRASRQVLGWWPHGDVLVLHSVIEKAGRHWCVTPQEAHVPVAFPFIPDAMIAPAPAGSASRYVRDGRPIDAGLRADPADYRAAIGRMRERLRTGMAPALARRLADEEAAERPALFRW